MKRLLLALVALLLTAVPASAEYYEMQALKGESGYRLAVTSAITTDDFLIAPAFGFNRVGYTKASDLEIEVFACENKTYVAGECTSFGALTSTTNSIKVETVRPWLIFDITAAETGANTSYVSTRGHITSAGGGGGGVLGSGPLASMLAASASAGDLWQQTDDDGTADCATGSGVAPVLLCQYDGASWIPAGIAGGTDNLGNHTATTDVDLADNAIVGAADVETAVLDGSVFYTSQYATVQLAIDACEAAGGGTVMLPAGNTAIDGGAASSPVIALGADTELYGHSFCELVGTGDALESGTGGGSTITITGDMSGKVGIHVGGSRQKLKNFTLKLSGTTDASTQGILFQSIDTSSGACDQDDANGTACYPGETGTNNGVLENVSISGPAVGGPGTGLELQFAQKMTIKGGEIQKWDTGVKLSTVPGLDALVDPDQFSPSSAGAWVGTKIRENDTGMLLADIDACNNLNLYGLTIEGNHEGLVAATGSDCMVSDFGSYYEQSIGTQATRRQVGWDTNGGNYYGYGVRFASAFVDAGMDFNRTVNQYQDYGPDRIIGSYFGNGPNTVGQLDTQGSRYIAGATGDVTGTFFSHATDCPTLGASDFVHVTGDACFERETDDLYICEPIAATGNDGICDETSEWVLITPDTAGDIVEIGNSSVGAVCASGTCFEGSGTEDNLAVTGDFKVRLDYDQGSSPGSNSFQVENGAGTDVFTAPETGVATASGGFSAPVLTGTTGVTTPAITLGSSSADGTILLYQDDAGGDGLAIISAQAGGTAAYILPTVDDGDTGECLVKTNDTSGLGFGACGGGDTYFELIDLAVDLVQPVDDTYDFGIGYDGTGTDPTDWAFHFDEDAGAFRINVPGGFIDIVADPTDGGALSLKEGVDDGTATWTIKAPDGGLTGDVAITHTLTADGELPTSVGGLGDNFASSTGELRISAGVVSADATPDFNLADATGLPISTGVAGLGTGSATALAINTGSDGAFGRIIAQGTVALDTDLIASTGCDTSDTGIAESGVLTTDVILWTPNADISAVTGYAPATTGGLIIYAYPTADAVNFKVCNPTSAGITPGSAVTLNYKVVR